MAVPAIPWLTLSLKRTQNGHRTISAVIFFVSYMKEQSVRKLEKSLSCFDLIVLKARDVSQFDVRVCV